MTFQWACRLTINYTSGIFIIKYQHIQYLAIIMCRYLQILIVTSIIDATDSNAFNSQVPWEHRFRKHSFLGLKLTGKNKWLDFDFKKGHSQRWQLVYENWRKTINLFEIIFLARNLRSFSHQIKGRAKSIIHLAFLRHSHLPHFLALKAAFAWKHT